MSQLPCRCTPACCLHGHSYCPRFQSPFFNSFYKSMSVGGIVLIHLYSVTVNVGIEHSLQLIHAGELLPIRHQATAGCDKAGRAGCTGLCNVLLRGSNSTKCSLQRLVHDRWRSQCLSRAAGKLHNCPAS